MKNVTATGRRTTHLVMNFLETQLWRTKQPALRVEELGDMGGDLAGSPGSIPPFSAWLSGIDIDFFSSAIGFVRRTLFLSTPILKKD